MSVSVMFINGLLTMFALCVGERNVMILRHIPPGHTGVVPLEKKVLSPLVSVVF